MSCQIYGCSGLYFFDLDQISVLRVPFASGEGRRVVSVFTQPPWSFYRQTYWPRARLPDP